MTLDMEIEMMKRRQAAKVEKEINERVATDMIKEKMPLDKIIKISKLSEDRIRKLAKSMGVAVL